LSHLAHKSDCNDILGHPDLVWVIFYHFSIKA